MYTSKGFASLSIFVSSTWSRFKDRHRYRTFPGRCSTLEGLLPHGTDPFGSFLMLFRGVLSLLAFYGLAGASSSSASSLAWSLTIFFALALTIRWRTRVKMRIGGRSSKPVYGTPLVSQINFKINITCMPNEIIFSSFVEPISGQIYYLKIL